MTEKEKIKEENPIEKLKRTLVNIDENLKKNYRMLADDLDDLVCDEESQSQDLVIELDNKKSFSVLKPASEILPTRKYSSSPKEVFTQITPEVLKKDEKIINNLCDQKQTQTIIMYSNHATNTESKIYEKIFSVVKFGKKTENSNFLFISSEDGIEDLVMKGLEKIKIIQNEFSTQTEQEKAAVEVLTDSTIVRGLMKKTRNYKKKDKHESFYLETHENIMTEERKTLSILETGPILQEKSQKEPLFLAAKEYKKEFKIQSQIKGLKKVDSKESQNL